MKEVRVRDLDTFLDLLQSSEREYPHVVGWIDAISGGSNFGRGVLELGRPSVVDVVARTPNPVSLPFDFPGWTLNRQTVGAFNAAYYRRIPVRGRVRTIHLNRFLFPLDAIHQWNRMYGRDGVYQFQCIVPFADGRAAIGKLMETVVRSGKTSFLAVIKAMGRHGQGLLSFPMPGFCLALDFPRRRGTDKFIALLHDIVIEYGGRVYLAKDALTRPHHYAAMDPRLPRFLALRDAIDPQRTIRSAQSVRLFGDPR